MPDGSPEGGDFIRPERQKVNGGAKAGTRWAAASAKACVIMCEDRVTCRTFQQPPESESTLASLDPSPHPALTSSAVSWAVPTRGCDVPDADAAVGFRACTQGSANPLDARLMSYHNIDYDTVARLPARMPLALLPFPPSDF
ncbi:hypothetical protein K0M31_009636 [Melipona bicolor]|uniref:Uncharacterized protein n=1 Tax=Melipona bicolor TaxID=60889 RepID=A0AA40FNJ6_9HYME|nr:hypothetical protein K0M31_009636 [Melipona bicolor]